MPSDPGFDLREFGFTDQRCDAGAAFRQMPGLKLLKPLCPFGVFVAMLLAFLKYLLRCNNW
ncbi:MAG: hypothetical protein ACREAB_07195 [Blastocatellia bacterium]